MVKKHNYVIQAKKANIAIHTLILATGILLLVLQQNHNGALKPVFILLGMAVGIVKLFGYFANDLYRLAFQFDLAIGSYVLAGSLLLFFVPKDNFSAFPFFIAFYLVLDSFIKLQTAYEGNKFGYEKWAFILIGAVVMLISAMVSVLLLFHKQCQGLKTALGFSIIINAIINILMLITTVKAKPQNVFFQEDEDE